MAKTKSKLLSDFTAARDALKTNCKKLLIETFGKILTDNPKLEAVSFTGYTPSFNDGEPCVFRIGEIDFKFKDEEDKENYDDWVSEYDVYGNEVEVGDISEVLGEMSGIISDVFGEYGFRAIFTRELCAKEEIKVEEYDCGY